MVLVTFSLVVVLYFVLLQKQPPAFKVYRSSTLELSLGTEHKVSALRASGRERAESKGRGSGGLDDVKQKQTGTLACSWLSCLRESQLSVPVASKYCIRQSLGVHYTCWKQ